MDTQLYNEIITVEPPARVMLEITDINSKDGKQMALLENRAEIEVPNYSNSCNKH